MSLHGKIEEELEKILRDRRDSITVGVYNSEIDPMGAIDFGDPKGGNVRFNGDFAIASTIVGNELKAKNLEIKTQLYYKINSNEDKDISLSLQTIHNFNTYKVAEFGKDTSALISDSNIRALVNAYINYQDVSSVLLLNRGNSYFIVPTPEEFIGIVNNKNIAEMTTAQKKSHEKSDLKVYETPTKILNTVVQAMSYDAFNALVMDEIASRAYIIITSSKKYKNEFVNNNDFFLARGTAGDMQINQFARSAFEYIAFHTLKSYGHPVRHSIMEDSERIERLTNYSEEKYKKFHEAVFDMDSPLHNERLVSLFEYIDYVAKKSKDNFSPLSAVLSDSEKYSEAVGRELKYKDLVVFDPQIGSAKEMFDASDNAGLGEHFKMWGTELRDDIDYSENAHRIHVLGGVNSATMSGAISDTFFQKKYDTAVQSMITWNNPPYSLDDGIAKTSLDTYKNGTMITGLYPTKMRNYIKNTMQDGGLIVDIPSEMTGYTDDNVPERFLLVFGKKYSKEAEAKENGEEFGGVFDHSTNKNVTELSLDHNATHEDLLKIINGYFSSRAQFGVKIMKNMHYFAERDWIDENILLKSIRENTNTIKSLYENAEKFSKVLEGDEVKEQFKKAIQPLQLARTEKVFLDTRFYSETSDYEAYNFNEVAGNVPLLIHYIKTKPKIFDIIESIADEQGFNLPVDKKTVNTDKFVVGKPFNGEKTRVATEKLGMMKFHFYPTDFDIKDEMSRDNLVKVISSIYEDNGRTLSNAEIKALKQTMKNSNVLTTKTETVSTVNSDIDEYLVQQRECLVLDGDIHSIKLNVSNFDLYKKLEEMNFFDINDYIEVVELQSDTKEKIFKGFVDYVENVTIKDIIAKTEGIGEDYIERALREKESIIKSAEENGEKKPLIKDIVSKINNNLEIRGYIEGYFRKNKTMDIKNIKPVLEKHLGWAFGEGTHTKNGREKLDNFVNMVEQRLESDKDAFFKFGFGALLTALKNATLKKVDKTENGLSKERQKEIDILFSNMEEEARVVLSELEKYVTETGDVGRRLGMTLYYTYPQMKLIRDRMEDARTKGVDEAKINETYAKAYDTLFVSWEKNVANLMEHQIKEPENFVEMEDVKTNFMLKKMRTGKTLTFIFTGFLEMMTKKNDMELYLHSNNIADIAGQLTQHIPILLPSVRIYASTNKHHLNEDLSFDTLYHTSAVTNPFKVTGFTKQIIGGGAEQERLANTFYTDMKMIKKALDKKYPDGVTLDDILKEYKDSPFISMIEKAKSLCG